MSPALALGIVEHTHDTNKELYHAVLSAVAEARKVRPIFLERRPRAARHADMVSMLARPRLELIAANLLRDWLMTKHRPMLCDFLDVLGLTHKEGALDELPPTMDDEKIRAGIDKLLASYPAEVVAVYLNAFLSMNDARWPLLQNMLKDDSRLQFGG